MREWRYWPIGASFGHFKLVVSYGLSVSGASSSDLQPRTVMHARAWRQAHVE